VKRGNDRIVRTSAADRRAPGLVGFETRLTRNAADLKADAARLWVAGKDEQALSFLLAGGSIDIGAKHHECGRHTLDLPSGRPDRVVLGEGETRE
jgi:hypothetical protein